MALIFLNGASSSLALPTLLSTLFFGGFLCLFCSEGGLFHARMSFTRDFPLRPPKLRFTSDMWHPNVHEDGSVCISILHAPGDDQYGYEDPSERWLPVRSIESIILSVISMLSSPNDESPANVVAAKEFRESPDAFNKRVRRLARKSQEEDVSL